MADTAELLKQKIRERRKQLQASGSVNNGFSNDESSSPIKSLASSNAESEDDETKSMLKDLERRRKRRQQRMKSKESVDQSNNETEITNLSELTSNLEKVKETVLKNIEPAMSGSPSKKGESGASAFMARQSSRNVADVSAVDQTSEQLTETKDVLKNSALLSDADEQGDTKSIIETESSASKTDAYRERIRNRMIKAKSIAENQTREDNPRERIHRMKKATAARQLENEKREEEEIKRKLAERKKAKEMLNQSVQSKADEPPLQLLRSSVDDNLDNSYDFFTKEYEEVERAVVSETSGGEAAEVENQEASETTKILRDYLTSADQEEIVKMSAVSYTPFRQRLAEENQCYFVPSVMSVSVQEKLPGSAENPRMAEDEGLFVGVKPQMKRCNVNKMENRIIRSDASKSWFGEDGVIKALSSPLERVPCTPFDVNAAEDMPQDLMTTYKKAVNSDQSALNQTADDLYQLDIDLAMCTFDHHPLFSTEHVLMRYLQNYFKQYCIIHQEDKITYLQHKLTALRTAAANMDLEDSAEEGDKSAKLQRLGNYRMEIKSTTMERDRMEAHFKKLQRNILRVWKAIKNLREQQKYANTSIKLVIHKEPTDEEEDQKIWDLEIENEVKDQEEDFRHKYDELYKKYQQEMNEWKQWNKRKKEAKRKEQAAQKSPKRKGSRSGSEELSVEDEQILNEEKKSKPNPPQPFNMEQAFDEVRQKAFRIKRHPGQPKLHFELKTSVTVTASNQCSKAEEQRRNEVAKHKIFIKILVNNKVVSATNPRALNSDFNITASQIFNVKVKQFVKEIKLQVYEIASMLAGSTLIAEVFLPIPDVKVTSNNVHLEDVAFSSEEVVRYHHEGVGSGTEFRNDCFDNPLVLLTTGTVKCAVSWAVSDDGKILGPPIPEMYNRSRSGPSSSTLFSASSIPELYKLVEWVKKSNLDPNDPVNGPLLHLMKTIGSKDGVVSAPDYFRLDHLQEEFNFATEKDIQDNLRFQMIELRESDTIPEFKNYHMIPLKEKEIPRELFDAHDKRKRRDQETDKSDDHRLRVSKFLSQVKEQVMDRFRQVQHQKTLEDIITEDEVPDIGTLGFNLLTLTNKNRPLRPARKERKKVTAQNIGGTEVKVVVNIGRAMDMPVRYSNKDGGRIRPNAPHSYHQLLRPFVEVMFQRQIVRTSVADGPNPTWNQELQLDFKAPHDNYSPANLETIRDVIYFNVFDEVLIDLLEDDRDRDTDVYQRMEKRFLGSLHIPFSTVYFNSKIEGTFLLNVPHVLLGYEKSHSHRYSSAFDAMQNTPDTNNSFLSIYVTIEPSLPPPDVFREKFESNESEKLLNHADKWRANLQATFPKRNIKTTVIDVQGKTVFITRYFRAIKPPSELLIGTDPTVIAERVARFVSLIPSISDSVMFPGLCDLWSTSDQFLQMLSGDEEEHAVLLCNYFSSLQKEVWLVIGVAVPEGPTAYVLTKEADDIWLWNASTGCHSSVKDSYNSLQSVGCLVNQDNIWANVQKNDKPSLMGFDLNRAGDWKPFFDRSNVHPGLSSVQLETLNYHATDGRFVSNTQERIENALRDNFTRWRCRSQARTRWNRHCKQVLAQILPKLEECAWHKNVHSDSVSQEMNQILTSYSMSGFPIQMPYTDVEAVVDAVYSTGLHLNKSDDAEFALAVYIHPYPCNVLAVWVYIAALIHI